MHIGRTPGIYVQAKKARSVVDQRRRKAEREAKRARGATSAAVPVAIAVGIPSGDAQELQRLRARVARLERENGKLRGRVQQLEEGQEQGQGALKRVKTGGLAMTTTAPLVPMIPRRPQLVRIPSDLELVEMDEDILQSMEFLKTLTPRVSVTPCGRPRSDSLADFLNGFGDFATTPQSRHKCLA